MGVLSYGRNGPSPCLLHFVVACGRWIPPIFLISQAPGQSYAGSNDRPATLKKRNWFTEKCRAGNRIQNQDVECDGVCGGGGEDWEDGRLKIKSPSVIGRMTLLVTGIHTNSHKTELNDTIKGHSLMFFSENTVRFISTTTELAPS